jgi:DNA-binding CsgD family transcriptional regulator
VVTQVSPQVIPSQAPVLALSRWGFSPDADRVYRALTASGPGRPGELARGLGLTPRQVREALDELAEAGAVRATARAGSGQLAEAAPRWAALPAQAVAARLSRNQATAGGASIVELTAREAAVVELLAAGHTDVSAGRQLGVSTRTISYAVRGLMDRLGVENRFQLGLALGAQGKPAPAPRTRQIRGPASPHWDRVPQMLAEQRRNA